MTKTFIRYHVYFTCSLFPWARPPRRFSLISSDMLTALSKVRANRLRPQVAFLHANLSFRVVACYQTPLLDSVWFDTHIVEENTQQCIGGVCCYWFIENLTVGEPQNISWLAKIVSQPLACNLASPGYNVNLLFGLASALLTNKTVRLWFRLGKRLIPYYYERLIVN